MLNMQHAWEIQRVRPKRRYIYLDVVKEDIQQVGAREDGVFVRSLLRIRFGES